MLPHEEQIYLTQKRFFFFFTVLFETLLWG